MTTEEIEKTAQEYTCNLRGAILKDVATSWFIVGAMYADSNWQEKTRWIPVEERLPVFGGKVRTILVKTSDNLYSFLWVMQEISLLDFELQSYTHWKEIEL